MNIIKSLKISINRSQKYNWDRLYFAVDLHGVIVKSNYENCSSEMPEIFPEAVKALKYLSLRKDIVLILYTSTLENNLKPILRVLEDEGIIFDYFNQNPEVENSSFASFDQKFYFSLLLDDKAGFDPEEDWDRLISFLETQKLLTQVA